MVQKKLKKPRNLTVAQWNKMKELQQRLQDSQEDLADTKQSASEDREVLKRDYELQLDRLRAKADACERAANDKNATIQRQSEDLTRAASAIRSTEFERDRIVRLCDQFLSVQIIGHGQTLNAATMQVMQDAPKSLRRT